MQTTSVIQVFIKNKFDLSYHSYLVALGNFTRHLRKNQGWIGHNIKNHPG